MSYDRPTDTSWLSRYVALWRRAPGTTAYLLASFVVSMVALSVLSGVFFAGVGMVILVVGLPLMSGSLQMARGLGSAERAMLAWTGLPEVPAPVWPRPAADAHWTSRALAPLRSAHHWSYLLHQLIINPVVSTVTFSLAITWWATTLGGLSYWFWHGFIPEPDVDPWAVWLRDRLPLLHGLTPDAAETTAYLVAGILFGITLPWVIRGLARLRHAIAAAMLGRWPSDELAARALAESEARQSAVHAEDTAMRRLERDLHDGPQQRLVRLQLDLAATERRAAAGDTSQAVTYAREAQLQAKAALDELRALSRGVAPPLLADRGLVAALDALAEESPLRVGTDLDTGLDASVPPEVARAIYFVVAELLTNAAKHSRASRATLSARIHGADPARLRVAVTDDGRGGAALSEGHGLAGLQERLHGLRGTLTVESPPGGPTRVDVVVPLPEEVRPAQPPSLS
ncbi:MAG TPA: sensor domain-containing protein [Propionicimonas sp.]|uniref:sensor histidine kinase n=1 Tax=Propionicimonas sp. TaxID=1955623 RepID=UPI002F3E34E9